MGRQIDLRILMKVVHNIDMPSAGEYVTVELSGGEVHHQAQVIDSCTPERIRLKLKGKKEVVVVSLFNVRSIDRALPPPPSSKKPRHAQDDKKTVFFGKHRTHDESEKIKQAMELLGIKVADDVTQADVHNAWIKVIKSAHPDKGGSHQKFLDIQEAYEKLQKA